MRPAGRGVPGPVTVSGAWPQPGNREPFVGRTGGRPASPRRAPAPLREPKPPGLRPLASQPASQPGPRPGEACHHPHRGLHSSPQRQSQKCPAAIRGIPGIQISTADIVSGFREPRAWVFTPLPALRPPPRRGGGRLCGARASRAPPPPLARHTSEWLRSSDFLKA